jgi:hypothetical protein
MTIDDAVDRIIECELSDKVREMKDKGLTQDEIAKQLLDDGGYDADEIGDVVVKVFKE